MKFLKSINIIIAAVFAALAHVSHAEIIHMVNESTSQYDVYRASGGYPEAFAQNYHNATYKPCKGRQGGNMCAPEDIPWVSASRIKQVMDQRPDTGSPYCGAVLIKVPKIQAEVPVQRAVPMPRTAPEPVQEVEYAQERAPRKKGGFFSFLNGWFSGNRLQVQVVSGGSRSRGNCAPPQRPPQRSSGRHCHRPEQSCHSPCPMARGGGQRPSSSSRHRVSQGSGYRAPSVHPKPVIRNGVAYYSQR